MASTEEQRVESKTKRDTVIISAITLCVTVIFGIVTIWVNKDLNTLTTEKTKLEIDNLKESLQRDFKIKILELCLNAVKEKNPKQQEVALMAVRNLVKVNDDFKQGLLKVLTDSDSPEVRKAAKVAGIVLQKDTDILTKTPKTKKFFVDIFYYEGEPSSKALAQKIYNALKFSDLYQVRDSVKELTIEKNKEANYKLVSSEIRYDPSEKADAETLQKTAEPLLKEFGITLKPARAGKETSLYLSLFVMEGPK